MSVEFDTPANRIIAQQQPKNQFRVPTDLPDLAFLRALSVQGRLTYNFFRNTVSTTNSLTPANGETQFIYRIIYNLSNTGSDWTAALFNNNIERSRLQFDLSTSDGSLTYTFDLMDSLVGDGMKTFDFINTEIAGSGALATTVLGWKENTSSK